VEPKLAAVSLEKLVYLGEELQINRFWRSSFWLLVMVTLWLSLARADSRAQCLGAINDEVTFVR
jgi:hypothetical protein